MDRLFVIALACLFALPAKSEVISLRPVYDPERPWTVRITEPALNPALGQVEAEVLVQVVGQGDDGAVLEWRWDRVRHEWSPGVPPFLKETTATVMLGLAYELQTGRRGELVVILNPEQPKFELDQIVLERAFPPWEKWMRERPSDWKSARYAMVRSVIQPEERLQRAQGQIHLFFSFTGIDLDTGRPLTRPFDRPNTFGAGRVRGESTVTVDSVRHDIGELYLTWTSRADQVVPGPLLRRLLRARGQQPELEERYPEPFMLALVDESAKVVIDLETGWPRKIEHTRTIRAWDLERVDETVLWAWASSKTPLCCRAIIR